MPKWCEIGKDCGRRPLVAVLLLAAACAPTVPAPTPAPMLTDRPTLTPVPTLALADAPTRTPAPLTGWRPAVGDTLQVQYSGVLDLTVAATVYDLDVDNTPAATVAALHAQGRHVFCYVDAGAWESYRADAAAYSPSVLGKSMEGWPDERWLDVRRIDLLAAPLRARLDTCAAKGFDGVDPDNVNGYTNDTGFPLTAADQLRFNRWLAAEAHARNLIIALKNDGEQAAELEPDFDAAVVEQCVEFAECQLYGPFVAAGKPVFDIEYSWGPSAFCPVAAALGIEIVRKRLELDAYRVACPG